MKLFNTICFLLIISISSLFADPAKPQRINDDPKVIGYLLLKDPSVFYTKFIKLSNAIYPGSGASIEANIATVKDIIDQSVSIGVVLYSKETFQDKPFIGIYITAKNKKVFENPMINMMPSHEVVDNTLVICTEPDGLNKMKEFQKNLIALKIQKDIEVFIDLKNIVKLNDIDITAQMPYAKTIFSQAEMVTIKIDLSDSGIETSTCLIATDKSNLQTALTQPSITSTDLLKITGPGNFMTGVVSYDLSKLKNFAQDLIKMANAIPEINDAEKKLLKEMEPIVLAFCDTEVMNTASTSAYKDMIKTKNIAKLKDPASFIKKMKDLYTKMGDPAFVELVNKTKLKDMYNFKWEDSEKYNGIQFYKLGSVSKEKAAEISKITSMSVEQYFAADQNYCYSASDIASLKELIDTAKANPKTDVPLDSFNFFKDGSMCYLDLFLIGYVKVLEKAVSTFGIKIDSLLALKLPPVKVAIKLDGNASSKVFIDTNTIASLVQKGFEIFGNMKTPQNEVPEEEMKAQP